MPQRFRIEQVFGLQSCISTVCGCLQTCIINCAITPRTSNPCATTAIGQLVFGGIFGDKCGCFACSSWSCALYICCLCKIPLGSCWCGCYLIPAGFLNNAGANPVCLSPGLCFADCCSICYGACFCTCGFTAGNGIYMALGAVPCMPSGTVGVTLFRRIS